ncbi:MAG: alpha/beta fold hydrolase [Candidatus Hydrogenedentes bacterium]|nr:alpha/beta fold hydrolase [Candidatus Hydrogenedentota bacterium]
MSGALALGCPAPPSRDEGFYGRYEVAKTAFRLTRRDVARTTVYEVVYFPCLDADTVHPDAAPCPVVLFAPGFNCPPLMYRSYGEQLASWGYIVHFAHYVGADNTVSTRDMSEHLDWLLERNADPWSLFAGAIDPGRIGVAGHSIGAKYVVMACIEDDRFVAGVSLDPVDGAASFAPASEMFPAITPERMPEVDEPILFIGTEYDSIFTPAAENYHQFFVHAESPAQELRVLNSDHVSFIDDVGGILGFMHLAFGNHEDVDDALAKRVAVRYLVSWFNVHLKGQAEFQTYLTGEMAQRDIDEGRVEIATNY